MPGRPGCAWPVHRNSWAGPWLICGVDTACRNVTLSTTRARCGSSSDSQAPDRPWRANAERRCQQARGALDEGEALALGQAGGQRLAVAGLQLRLGGEQIQLRRAAGHGQADDLPGARPGPRQQRAIQQRQRQRAHARPGVGQQRAAADRPGGRHGRRAPSTAAGRGAQLGPRTHQADGPVAGQRLARGDRLVRHAGGGQPGAVAVEAVPAHGHGTAPQRLQLAVHLPRGARLGCGRRRRRPERRSPAAGPRGRRRRAARWTTAPRAAGLVRPGRQQQPAQQPHRQQPQLRARTGPTTAPGCRTPSPAAAPPRPAAAAGSAQAQRPPGERRRSDAATRTPAEQRAEATQAQIGLGQRWQLLAADGERQLQLRGPVVVARPGQQPHRQPNRPAVLVEPGRQLDAEEVDRARAGHRVQRMAVRTVLVTYGSKPSPSTATISVAAATAPRSRASAAATSAEARWSPRPPARRHRPAR